MSIAVFCPKKACTVRSGNAHPGGNRIHSVWVQRRALHPRPLTVVWIPAHQIEQVADADITEEQAQKCGTTKRHVILNRKADHAAKTQALAASPVRPEVQHVVQAAVGLHQEWLTKLHCHLDTSAVGIHHDDQLAQVDKNGGSEHLSRENAPKFFPEWPWGASAHAYKWLPKIPHQVDMPKRWRHSEKNWKTICDFLRSLRWKIHKDDSAAFCEFALAFHTQLDTA